MTSQFTSFKSLIEHVRLLESLPYERDVEDLREMVENHQLLKLPKVMVENDEIQIEDGDLDECQLDNMMEVSREDARVVWGLPSNSGIVVSVRIGDLTFEKDDWNEKWECVDDGLKGLPLGYEAGELEEELHGDCYDEFDLLSEAIDDKIDGEHLFRTDYRLFQSVEDDAHCIAEQLDDLGYDGFYWFFRRFYGWRKGMEEPWMNFDPIQLFTPDEIARRYVKQRGWCDEI